MYFISLAKELFAMMIKHINSRPCLKRLDASEVLHRQKLIPQSKHE